MANDDLPLSCKNLFAVDLAGGDSQAPAILFRVEN